MSDYGYVDLQINGNYGVDFSDPELTGEMFLMAAELSAFLRSVRTGAPDHSFTREAGRPGRHCH